MKTLPAASTAIFSGVVKVPSDEVPAPGVNVRTGPVAVPYRSAKARTLLEPSTNSTAPAREPGDFGVKFTNTVQEVVALKVPATQVPPPALAKSGPTKTGATIVVAVEP